MKLSQLGKVGLKEKEIKVYLALLKEGSSLANQLAKKTNILRSSIYDYLDILLEKGFVSYTIKSGKKYFQTVAPQKILDDFKEKKQKEEEILKEIVPKLTQLQNTSDKKVFVEVFEGKEGMKTTFSRILKENPKELFVFGSSGVGYKLLPYFLEHWHNERIKKKIKMKIIYNAKSEAQKRIKEGPSLKFSEVKFLSEEHISITGTLIYNNKVLLTIWNKESPLAISIESEDISKSYRNNFNLLWKIAKR